VFEQPQKQVFAPIPASRARFDALAFIANGEFGAPLWSNFMRVQP
jgi:hypothetical protein